MSGQKRYIPTLDGWRALSVIGVILYHGRFGFFSDGTLPSKLAGHGSIGVDVFFAISGFLICGLLLEEYSRTGDISLRRFYVRRCFRILPPYYVALAGICTLSVLGVLQVHYPYLPSCLLFYRNYMPLGADQAGGFYTAHFWSLAVEEHFYLLWPMLLLGLRPKLAGRAALTIALLVFAWRQTSATLWPALDFGAHTDTRIDALLWGCLAALYFPEIKRVFERIGFRELWLPIAAILVLVEAMHVPGLTLLRAILLPALILSTVIQPTSLLGHVLEWQVFRWIGTISYSLYLWQELFLPEMASTTAKGAFQHLQHWPANVVAMVLCAVLSRYLIEVPMTRLGHRVSASRLSLATPAHASPGLSLEITAKV
ncbi:MAG: acyltransferase [Acidobacteriaceae bacterium]